MKNQNPYIKQNEDGSFEVTAEGQDYLAQSVTNTSGSVYSFLDKFSPTIIAAAMARLSRFGGDMRELILKEFANQEGQDEALLRRVLTQFGDDSVQQLSSVPVVVENASNLLTKQLEWGRLAAYLEQSTRYIYYDEKKNDQYRYYTPNNLPKKLASDYKKVMDQIFDNYSQIVRKMTEYYHKIDDTPKEERDVAWRIAMRGKACDAARGLLPAATTSTVGIVGSGQAIDNLIMNLLSQDLPEAQEVGKQILQEVRKQHGIFFERTDMPNRGGATVEHKRKTRALTKHVATSNFGRAISSYDNVPVKLLDYTPKDEYELIAHMLYPHTSLSFDEIKDEVKSWDKAKKAAAFDVYVGERSNRRHKPGRALEVAHYTFELVCDYGIFRDLQRHRMVDALEWQLLSPNLSYEVPQPIIDAKLDDLYNKTLQISESLYKKLNKAGFLLEAQYATLFCNRMRWKLTINARAAFHLIELRTQPAGHIGYRKLAKQMHDEIAKVHPHLAEAMLFVNREADDPTKSRLEQARHAQRKLQALGLEGLIE
ncbi:MAG: FAD-dependent thymidylate synthase [Candidatus Woesebacteria bacterium]